tara:strand:+ start:343 stop:849 length:507 start_codon:yes stop_codon:yes gene_type:complete
MSFKYENKPFKKKSPLYKIYLDDDKKYFNFFSDKENFESLKKFNHKIIEKNYIFSDEGIYLRQNNKITKIEYEDSPVKFNVLMLGDKVKKIFIDNSKEILAEQVYQIPYNHSLINQEINMFSVNEKSDTKLVVIKQNDEIVDLYFQLSEDFEHLFIKEDIFTLLLEEN